MLFHRLQCFVFFLVILVVNTETKKKAANEEAQLIITGIFKNISRVNNELKELISNYKQIENLFKSEELFFATQKATAIGSSLRKKKTKSKTKKDKHVNNKRNKANNKENHFPATEIFWANEFDGEQDHSDETQNETTSKARITHENRARDIARFTTMLTPASIESTTTNNRRSKTNKRIVAGKKKKEVISSKIIDNKFKKNKKGVGYNTKHDKDILGAFGNKSESKTNISDSTAKIHGATVPIKQLKQKLGIKKVLKKGKYNKNKKKALKNRKYVKNIKKALKKGKRYIKNIKKALKKGKKIKNKKKALKKGKYFKTKKKYYKKGKKKYRKKKKKFRNKKKKKYRNKTKKRKRYLRSFLQSDDDKNVEHNGTKLMQTATACLRLVIKRCYLACKDTLKNSCLAAKCTRKTKDKFREKSKTGCIMYFDEKPKDDNSTLRTYNNSMIEYCATRTGLRLEESLITDNDANFSKRAELKIEKQSESKSLLIPKSNDTLPLQTNNSEPKIFNLNIRRSSYDKQCSKYLRNKCIDACHYAYTETCTKKECSKDLKKKFRTNCKRQCKERFRIYESSSDSYSSTTTSDSSSTSSTSDSDSTDSSYSYSTSSEFTSSSDSLTSITTD